MNKINILPMPGDVITVNRGLYKHYGIYVGNNMVVHFSGGQGGELSSKRACIRKTSLEEFRKNGEILIETRCCKSFSNEQTVQRAIDAIGSGKGKYALPWNNCEHFANWCRYGEKRSLQVEKFTGEIISIGVLVIGTVLLNYYLYNIKEN